MASSYCAWACLLAAIAADSSANAQIDLISKEAAIEGENRGGLRWSGEWKLNDEYQFLITHHATDDSEALAIYLRLSAGYLRVEQILLPELTRFEYIEPFFWTQPILPHEKTALIWVQILNDGTGHQTDERFFTPANLPPIKVLENSEITDDIASAILQDVEYLGPPSPFKPKLLKGQGFWKGALTTFGPSEMSFEHYIYNQGDGNCCPSGSKLYGTFKLVVMQLEEPKNFGPVTVTKRYRIETDSFKQVPIED